MSFTYTQFRDAVLAAYNPAAQSTDRENAAIGGIAKRVMSEVIRLVEGDLSLAKSYENDYRDVKTELAGFTLTSNFATVKAEVLIQIGTTYGNMDSIDDFIDDAVQQAMDDFNGTSTLFDTYVLEAAIEIQRKATCYQGPLESTFLYDDSEVSNQGFVSVIELPTGANVLDVRKTDYFAALAGNTAYAADDIVTSNGRLYKCSTAGTTAADVSAGLTSTDSDEPETSGTAAFTYYRPIRWEPLRAVAWKYRDSLYADDSCLSPLYTVDLDGSELWVYPALDDTKQVRVQYNAFKTSFSGSDATKFDTPAAQCAAQWVRFNLMSVVAKNQTEAKAAYGIFQNKLKNLWLDCGRKRGSTIL